jgi:predicted ester cyclase
VQITIEEQIAAGDKVVTRWTARGTHKDELMSITATDERAAVTGIRVGQVVNGKFVEIWTNFDALGMLQQLGVIPPPGQESRENRKEIP